MHVSFNEIYSLLFTSYVFLEYSLLKKMMAINKECVSKPENNGETALHYAAEAGRFETAEAIIVGALDDFDLTKWVIN